MVWNKLLEKAESAMLYYPTRALPATPEGFGAPFEDVWLRERDPALHGWWVPALGGAPRAALVFYHGNAGNISDRAWFYADMARRGVNVLAAEYPGYGQCEGEPSQKTLFAAGERWAEELRRRAPDLPRIVHGRSLGGAVACHVAGAGYGDRLLLESTFTSLPDIAASLLPFGARLTASEFPSRRTLARVTLPTLIVHGTDDELIPVAHGQLLYEAAAGDPKRLLLVERGTHNDVPLVGGDRYWRALERWFGGDYGAPEDFSDPSSGQ